MLFLLTITGKDRIAEFTFTDAKSKGKKLCPRKQGKGTIHPIKLSNYRHLGNLPEFGNGLRQER